MSKRGYWFLIALVTTATLGAQFIGEWVRLSILIAVGVAGIALTIWAERRKWRITQFLANQSENEQDARLVWLEGWADRPEILANLERQGPRVPLRSERERFVHDGHHLAVLRWTFGGTALLVLFLAYIAVLRPPEDRDQWPYLILLLVGFGASLIYLPSQMRLYAERIEVTEAALEIVRSNGRREVMPWDSIREVRNVGISSVLVVRSPTATVRIPHIIQGYGRLANLIATRVSPTVAWRVV